jgi:hypothetical protein
MMLVINFSCAIVLKKLKMSYEKFKINTTKHFVEFSAENNRNIFVNELNK